jgi:CRP-like cAMP-binding protein
LHPSSRSVTLAGLELFADASAAELSELQDSLERVEVDADDALVREGEPGDCFLLVVQGEATVTRDGLPVGRVGPGSIVGELALLRGGLRTATVTATTPVIGLAGDAESFGLLTETAGVRERFGRTAAQRLAASVQPVPATLQDGTAVQLRPVLPADRARLTAAFDGDFSADSQRKRFFSPGRPSAALISYLVDVDYVDHFAWVVLLAGPDEAGKGVASARYIRLADDPDTAEIAFGVVDAYQGRGLGRLLLGALGAAAPVGDVLRFRASVLADNAPMRKLLDRPNSHWTREEPGVVATVLDAPALRDLIDPATAAALEAEAQAIVAAAHLALA